jgi:hypothetical protein
METDTLLWIAAGLFVYFFPSYLAIVMRHLDWKAVVGLNILWGWTIIMWFVLIFWAINPKAPN